MDSLRAQISRYADTELPVLIRGETGVGKDLAARALHKGSTRANGPFAVVNCASLPPTLVESEFFGTVSGAFTGASTRNGWFRRAHGGTLFLDEIGDMPLEAQRILLRVLEEPKVWPIGSERPVPIDCRILCATHQDLEGLVAQRQFRADLFHRINVLTIHIPPLRSRSADIGALSRVFMRGMTPMTAAAIAALKAHNWPGNIRELRNIIRAAEVEADGQPIDVQHLSLKMRVAGPRQKTIMRTDPLAKAIQAHIRSALQSHQGNVRATARALEVSPTTVYRYLSLPC